MNEITITVKAINGTRFAKAEAIKDAKQLGTDMGTAVSQGTEQALNKEARAGSGAYSRAGQSIGETIGRTASERIAARINERVRVSVDQVNRGSDGRSLIRDSRGRFVSGAGSGGMSDNDRTRVDVDVNVDKPSLLQRFAALGKAAGDKFTQTFGSAFSSLFSGDILSKLLIGGAIAGLAGMIAPALGAAITSGILLALGGGAIAVGIVGALQDPRIQDALKGLKTRITGLFENFSANFKGPLEDFLAPGDKGGGGITGLLDQLTPQIEALGKVLGPLAATLGQGIIGMLQNMLPGILRAVEGATPLVEVLASELPGIGTAIGKFFDQISRHGPEAAVFFNDLLNVVQLLIGWLGNLISNLTFLYVTARNTALGMAKVFLDSLYSIATAAAMALSWVPGLGPKLQTAAIKVGQFRDKVNAQLAQIQAQKTITIRFRVIGIAAATAAVETARILKGMGYAHGGIKGAATGGNRSGLTWVGEEGPELLDLAPGTRVNSKANSMQMAREAANSNNGPMIVQLILDGIKIAEAMVTPQRDFVRTNFAGNVQAAYGYGG